MLYVLEGAAGGPEAELWNSLGRYQYPTAFLEVFQLDELLPWCGAVFCHATEDAMTHLRIENRFSWRGKTAKSGIVLIHEHPPFGPKHITYPS